MAVTNFIKKAERKQSVQSTSARKELENKKRESNILNKIVLVECFYSDIDFF